MLKKVLGSMLERLLPFQVGLCSPSLESTLPTLSPSSSGTWPALLTVPVYTRYPADFRAYLSLGIHLKAAFGNS